MVRLAASLLAVVMFATSGAIGGVAYLCLMDGQVRSECCCKKAQAETDEDCAKVERADDCCEVRVTKVDHQPARLEATKQHVQPLPMVATLPSLVRLVPPTTDEANLPPGARGPPPGNGPPLFIWNCSYLI